jgi:uncharacterized protein DUF3106
LFTFMPSFSPYRHRVRLAAATLTLLTAATFAPAQPRGAAGGHFFANQARPVQGHSQPRPPQQRGESKQEHLSQWMDRHSNLSLPEQQKALESEPGFHNLSPESQQRLRNSLAKLHSMSPEQRQRYLSRTEAMERLTPDQRQQVRSAMGQLGSLPVDRQRQVSRAFWKLRGMPESQRQATLNSDKFKTHFSDQERSTINNLLSAEPYLPVQRPNDGSGEGKP